MEKPEKKDVKRGQKWGVKLFPYGVSVKMDCDVWPIEKIAVGHDWKRGKITTFSKNSSTRLRRFILENFVPGREVYSFTLTTRENFAQDDWRKLMVRFNKLCLLCDYSGVWRVELQTRRAAPHLHCIFFCQSWHEAESIKLNWLRLSGGFGDKDSQEYSVLYSAGLSVKWIMYLSGHLSKKKEGQLGWLGRYWGVWNRKNFEQCLMKEYSLEEKVYFEFCRVCRRWLAARGSFAGFRIPAWYRVGLRNDWAERLLSEIKKYVYDKPLPYKRKCL